MQQKQQKRPEPDLLQAPCLKKTPPQATYSPTPSSGAVPSARGGLTALFGMGRV